MNPEKIGKNIAKFLLMEEITETVAIYPGAFKPPHKGHVDVILKALNFSLNNDRKINGPTMPSSTQTPGKAIVFVSEKTRENVDYNESLAVWDLYKEAIPELNNVEFISTPTPVTDVYHYVKENPTHDIKAVFGKGEESRFERLQDKSKYPHVELFNAGTFQDLSATNLRKAISNKDKETIKTFIPDGVDVDEFLSIFQSDELNEGRKKKKDPKKGTGKKPKGSDRRLYTDEDPKDTVGVKFSSRQDIVDTFSKKSFKAKSHARQSQVINLVHQRVRAAYNRAKDPAVKKRLKTALEYVEKRKEASKAKTQRLKKQKSENIDPKSQAKHKGNSAPFGSAYEPVKEVVNEAWEPQKAKVINKFLHFASDYLSTDRPKIKLLNGPEFTQTYHSFGGYHPGEENIQIVVYNRNMADILRTLAHEMVHRMQHLDNRLGPNSGDDGSPEENEANSLAGVMLRQFGRENPGIYE